MRKTLRTKDRYPDQMASSEPSVQGRMPAKIRLYNQRDNKFGNGSKYARTRTAVSFYLTRMTTRYSKIRKVFDYQVARKEEITRCPGCNGTKQECFRDFGYIDRYGYYAKTSWCGKCGMVYLNPRMRIEEYNRFYASGVYRKITHVFSNKSTKSSTKDDYIPGRVRVAKDIFLQSGYKEKRLNMLDIGGTKEVFEYLNSVLNIDKYTCINPAGDEIDINKTSSHEVFEGTIEEFDSNEKKYDFICLFGTLNHLIEPLKVFRKISYLLKDEGFFTFDHVNRISKMKASAHPSHQIQIDHAVYPGSGTVLHMLGESGLEIEKKQQSGKAVDVYLVKKRIRRSRSGAASVDLPEMISLSHRMTSIPLNYLIRKLVSLVR